MTVTQFYNLLTLEGVIDGGAGIWPAVIRKENNKKESFLSGSSIMSFTPYTADMSLNP